MAELRLVEVELDNDERELLPAYLLACTARGVAKDKERTGGKGSRSPSGGNRPPFARAVVPPEVTAGRVAVSAGGAYYAGDCLFVRGKTRTTGRPWRMRRASALGDAMVVLFFGWMVLRDSKLLM